MNWHRKQSKMAEFTEVCQVHQATHARIIDCKIVECGWWVHSVQVSQSPSQSTFHWFQTWYFPTQRYDGL